MKVKSELQKAKEASAKDKDKFAAWLYKELDNAPHGTVNMLSVYLKKSRQRVYEYKNGIIYPPKPTRKKIETFFKQKLAQ